MASAVILRRNKSVAWSGLPLAVRAVIKKIEVASFAFPRCQRDTPHRLELEQGKPHGMKKTHAVTEIIHWLIR